jgi:hypothetical protein
MRSLTHLVPCVLCREHLSEIYSGSTLPLTPTVFDGQRSFGEYVVRLRDLVKRSHVLVHPHEKRLWPDHDFDHDVARRLLAARRSGATAFAVLLAVLATAAMMYSRKTP